MLLLASLHFSVVQPLSVVSFQDSLLVTCKLTSTRLVCLTLILTFCLLSVHFFQWVPFNFQNIHYLVELLGNMLQYQGKRLPKWLYSPCSNCFIISALLPTVRIIETQCWHLPFFLLLCYRAFHVFLYIFHRFFLWLSLVKYTRKYFEYLNEYLLWNFNS